MSSQESQSEEMCPICLEELDATDKSFKPCQCGYQMCRFCFNRIKEEFNGKCPNCRRAYDEQNFSFVPPDPMEFVKSKKDKKPKEKKLLDPKKQLANVRIVQRNLVYVTNLSLPFAKEENLRKIEYFGQFGKITKVVINRSNIYNAESPQGPSVSSYITFQNEKMQQELSK